MAPFSPLPLGSSIRRVPRPAERTLPHPLSPTASPYSSRSVEEEDIICGPDSKGWMVGLLFSCLMIVVWLSTLPVESTPSAAMTKMDPMDDLFNDIVTPFPLMKHDGTRFLKAQKMRKLAYRQVHEEPTPSSSIAAVPSTEASLPSEETSGNEALDEDEAVEGVEVMGDADDGEEMPEGESNDGMIQRDLYSPTATIPSSTISSIQSASITSSTAWSSNIASSTTFSAPERAKSPTIVQPDGESAEESASEMMDEGKAT